MIKNKKLVKKRKRGQGRAKKYFIDAISVILLRKKIMKINEQRFAMIVLLCNVLDTESEDEVSNGVKSAISASLLNVIEMSFIPGDDDALANLINVLKS